MCHVVVIAAQNVNKRAQIAKYGIENTPHCCITPYFIVEPRDTVQECDATEAK